MKPRLKVAPESLKRLKEKVKASFAGAGDGASNESWMSLHRFYEVREPFPACG
jgi:hypothetical protein